MCVSQCPCDKRGCFSVACSHSRTPLCILKAPSSPHLLFIPVSTRMHNFRAIKIVEFEGLLLYTCFHQNAQLPSHLNCWIWRPSEGTISIKTYVRTFKLCCCMLAFFFGIYCASPFFMRSPLLCDALLLTLWYIHNIHNKLSSPFLHE